MTYTQFDQLKVGDKFYALSSDGEPIENTLTSKKAAEQGVVVTFTWGIGYTKNWYYTPDDTECVFISLEELPHAVLHWYISELGHCIESMRIAQRSAMNVVDKYHTVLHQVMCQGFSVSLSEEPEAPSEAPSAC